jgi:Peptidase S46
LPAAHRTIALLAILALAEARADEGMWLLNDFPSKTVQAAYGFAPSQAWLDKIRLGAIRLANGCSASLVSANGLVMTNHHCVRDCVQDLSTPRRDYLAQGFFAASERDERRCPKLEANQLVSISDVTERILTATRGKEGASYSQALKQEMARIEGECATSASVRCDVVTLFHGGKYNLYAYRRFQDVRLVFAPEFPMAAFGGYPDNFNFPRYGFDIGFLRVYENDKAVRTPDALPWAKTSAQEGDLVFVAGNPGGTERVQTVEQLAFQRDVALPWTLVRLAELRGVMLEFSKGNPELYRVTRAHIRSVENALKGLGGRQAYLADPVAFEKKRSEDAALRAAVKTDPARSAKYGAAWDGIARAVDAERTLFPRYRLEEAGEGFQSELFDNARLLVRAAEEAPKPSPERLREYTDARIPALKQRLLRPVPIPRQLERVTMGFGLRRLRDQLGADDPFVQTVLGKEAPEDLAKRLVDGTRLDEVKVREALWSGGRAAIESSTDPMIVLARRVDSDARAVRKAFEDQVEAALAKNGELLHQANVAVHGTSSYPDATFTLRLSYGKIAGWEENGRNVPAMTRFAGLYARDTGKFPFAVAPTWLRARGRLDPDTPMNVATTNDIIGGNSGSPLINRDGEVVGLIFDGNLPSLGGDYGYQPATNRAVALHGAAILEGLDKVYGASRLAQEIRGQSSRSASSRH